MKFNVGDKVITRIGFGTRWCIGTVKRAGKTYKVATDKGFVIGERMQENELYPFNEEVWSDVNSYQQMAEMHQEKARELLRQAAKRMRD